MKIEAYKKWTFYELKSACVVEYSQIIECIYTTTEH